ncbi:MAG: hypothetical protein M1834_007809 [Cirrosporium novae-zelandiae]|nr:MAG: hypothetical protein M1834_007809 [Cirrosporium novae-zelandiae]
MSHPFDLEINARLLQWTEVLTSTEPLASLLKKGGRRIHSDQPLSDLDNAREVVKDTILSHFHVTGSCAMMPKELGGVVNDHLLVHGTKNLRIVDASIMPLIPRGNIMTSVYAVAKKVANIIKDGRRSYVSKN